MDIVYKESVKQVNFLNYGEAQYQGDYIILSHPKLYDDGNGINYVDAYKDYKQTTGYDATIIDVTQLFDQFAFGITPHFVAINKFLEFVSSEWTAEPEHFFIIGKGFSYTSFRNPNQFPNILVPTFGDPGADNLLASDLTSVIPNIAIGRLAATTGEDVNKYLQKLIAYEAAQNVTTLSPETTSWMKNVIHLGGGNTAFEQASIRSSLNSMSNSIESEFFGGQVHSFFKDSSDPIQIAVSTQLDSLIDNGSALMTFFGHSSANSFDFSVDNPSLYENEGRYPVFLSLGCYSGAIHGSNNQSLSTTFVFEQDKGAIAFIASTELATLHGLDNMANEFYKQVSIENYGETLGKQLKTTYANIEQTFPNSIFHRLINEHNTLHGDPSLKMYGFIYPDYYIENSFIRFDPIGQVANSEEFLTANIKVTNLGKALNTTMPLKVTLYYPDGSFNVIYDELVQAPLNEKIYTIQIPLSNENQIGLNRIEVEVDDTNLIEEYDNITNNSAENNFFVYSDDVVPVFPIEFGITDKNSFDLIGASSSIFGDNSNYLLEIDTTELFNSTLHTSTIKTLENNIISWSPDIQKLENTVYYWRIAKQPSGTDTAIWSNSSFLYLSNIESGWNQSHYYQFLKDGYSNINLTNTREFEFFDIDKVFEINNGNTDSTTYNVEQVTAYLNNTFIESRTYLQNRGGITVVVLDSVSVIPWQSVNQGVDPVTGDNIGQYGNWHADINRDLNIFEFPSGDPIYRQRLIAFLNTIPDKNYVGLFTVNNNHFDDWEPELKQALTDLGAAQVDNITNHVPYGLIIRKGRPEFQVAEVLASDPNEIIQVEAIISSPYFAGQIESTRIGPALNWNELHFDIDLLGNEPSIDLANISIVGIDQNGVETILESEIMDTPYNLSNIDANTYPFLKLQFNTEDEKNFEPAQLEFWRILYQAYPEATISPSELFVFNDTIPQGQDAYIRIASRNISNVNMDSLLVKYTVIDNTNTSTTVATNRYRPLPALDTISTDLSFSTVDLAGHNTLIVEINPDEDQEEQFHFNNFAFIPFFVDVDKTNPLLDVTFDGVHILDGDIVSPKPFIKIELKDENKFLALEDTTLINVFINDPNGQLTRVSFDNVVMRFFPADASLVSEDNRANIEYRPTFEQDGIYELIVQARDASNNPSGLNDYKISFEIINRSMISNLINYPNPFSTSTQFVFTLTGSELPTNLKIQVMTVTGKVVREITMDELGPLHIGRNITEFAWDGTDSYGDRLANGVYFYRVVTSKADNNYEHFETNADSYFKEGIGKMYLMR